MQIEEAVARLDVITLYIYAHRFGVFVLDVAAQGGVSRFYEVGQRWGIFGFMVTLQAIYRAS